MSRITTELKISETGRSYVDVCLDGAPRASVEIFDDFCLVEADADRYFEGADRLKRAIAFAEGLVWARLRAWAQISAGPRPMAAAL